MEFLIANWYIGLGLITLLLVLGLAVYLFFQMPTNKQLDKVRQWLIFAVTEAEVSLGGGVGQLKLRWVYDMFVTRFKWISMLITFETFSLLVDEALDELKEMLKTNKAVRNLVEGNKE